MCIKLLLLNDNMKFKRFKKWWWSYTAQSIFFLPELLPKAFIQSYKDLNKVCFIQYYQRSYYSSLTQDVYQTTPKELQYEIQMV